MKRPSKHAFTTLEMIIVIGFIAGLIAILVPMLTAVRRSSVQTTCASNLRQIGQSLHTYRTDCGTWPHAVVIPPAVGNTSPALPGAPTLPEALAAHLSPTSPVYHCPGDKQQVYDRCGISYGYYLWMLAVPGHPQPLMQDFQGYASTTGTVMIDQFHPPRMGMNVLHTDGSVIFGHAQP